VNTQKVDLESIEGILLDPVFTRHARDEPDELTTRFGSKPEIPLGCCRPLDKLFAVLEREMFITDVVNTQEFGGFFYGTLGPFELFG
jgi:hypothetical protein